MLALRLRSVCASSIDLPVSCATNVPLSYLFFSAFQRSGPRMLPPFCCDGAVPRRVEDVVEVDRLRVRRVVIVRGQVELGLAAASTGAKIAWKATVMLSSFIAGVEQKLLSLRLWSEDGAQVGEHLVQLRRMALECLLHPHDGRVCATRALVEDLLVERTRDEEDLVLGR